MKHSEKKKKKKILFHISFWTVCPWNEAKITEKKYKYVVIVVYRDTKLHIHYISLYCPRKAQREGSYKRTNSL